MFIISLTYKVPLETVERHLEAHIEWLKKGYSDGICVASGGKIPRSGGVILARGTRDQIEAFSQSDPFIINGIADYDITETAFSMTADGFESLKD